MVYNDWSLVEKDNRPVIQHAAGTIAVHFQFNFTLNSLRESNVQIPYEGFSVLFKSRKHERKTKTHTNIMMLF